jgi:hypothetical protein
MTDLTDRLRAAIAALESDQFLVAGEPEPEADPARGFLVRLRPRRAAPTRYVQLLRMDDLLLAEAVGAESFGGHYPFDPATDTAVRALGWSAPDVPDADPTAFPNYRRRLPAGRPAEAAALLLETLTTMGVDLSTVTIDS